ncbi:MAG: DUF2065 domain-containing protein [Chromatiales bacterium]|nr:DUF2065 domain-containing protein [Chromatiales bacterium]
MSWSDLGAGFALFLIFEGLMPFLSPAGWRQTLHRIAGMRDGQLRFIGLGSILAGLLLLLIVRG